MSLFRCFFGDCCCMQQHVCVSWSSGSLLWISWLSLHSTALYQHCHCWSFSLESAVEFISSSPEDRFYPTLTVSEQLPQNSVMTSNAILSYLPMTCCQGCLKMILKICAESKGRAPNMWLCAGSMRCWCAIGTLHVLDTTTWKRDLKMKLNEIHDIKICLKESGFIWLVYGIIWRGKKKKKDQPWL